MTGGLGVVILVFVFGLAPGDPPIDVMLIILAAVMAASALEAAQGMDYLVKSSERLLRRFPKAITFLGPLVTYAMTLCAGTGHTVYAIQPIIADVARKTGIRPERPLSVASVASVASQLGITASPLSAAVVYLVSEFESRDLPFTLGDVLKVTIPSTIIGILLAATVANFVGKELHDDPEYQRRMADPELRAEIEAGDTSMLDREFPVTAKLSVALAISILVNSQAATAKILTPLAFTLGVAPATLIGIFPSVYAYFFIPNYPNYPSDLATVSFDRTGTTHIGKYLLNHSFMIPGMIAVWTSVLVGVALSSLLN